MTREVLQSNDEVTASAPSDGRRPPPEGPAVPRTSPWLGWAEKYSLVVLVAGLVALFSLLPATAGTFLTSSNLQSLILTQSVIAIAALAVTVPLVAGQFDVSIGPVLGMTSVLVGSLTVDHGVSVPLALLAGVLAGGLVGAVNGAVVAYMRTNSLIITLGSGTLVGGIVSYATDNQIITGAPQALVDLGTRSVAGLPWLGWILILVATVVWFMLRYTLLGRRLTLAGSNRAAARIVGVRVERTVFLSFVVAGLVAGIAGVLLFAQTGAANPQIGTGYTLPALAAAFLGATTIRPGQFNIAGTIVGVFFVAVAVNGLTLAGAAAWVQPVFDGGSLVIAVALSSLLSRRTGGAASA